MTVAYYITAHGFGHVVRSAAVMRALPAELPVDIRTDVPAWFLNHELHGANFTVHPGGFDCGTLGRDSTSVDAALTFDRAERVLEENEARRADELKFLKSRGIRLVVSDMPSFPLALAREADIPSLCVTNFTWVEIYRALTERSMAEGRIALAARGEAILAKLRAEYAAGELLAIPGLALPMEACRRRLEIPVIVREGVSRRALLCEKLGLDPARPIYLIYLGQDGYAGMEWDRLREFGGAQFVSFRRILGTDDETVRVIPQGLIDHADATASADAVIGKLGYSLCAECLASRRPLIFPPRPDFIEALALARGMMDHGLGLPLEAEPFRRLEWGPALAAAPEIAAAAKPVDCSGAQICAEIIHLAWREGGLGGVLD